MSKSEPASAAGKVDAHREVLEDLAESNLPVSEIAGLLLEIEE